MNPLQVPQQGPYGESCLFTGPFCISLKGPRKGASLHFPQKWGPYGNRRPFPESYLVGGTCTYLPNCMMLHPSKLIPILTPDTCQCCNITVSVMEKLWKYKRRYTALSVHRDKVNLLPCSELNDIMHVFCAPHIRHQPTDRVTWNLVQMSGHCKSPSVCSSCKLVAQNA
jgi:hypothetical protein